MALSPLRTQTQHSSMPRPEQGKLPTAVCSSKSIILLFLQHSYSIHSARAAVRTRIRPTIDIATIHERQVQGPLALQALRPIAQQVLQQLQHDAGLRVPHPQSNRARNGVVRSAGPRASQNAVVTVRVVSTARSPAAAPSTALSARTICTSSESNLLVQHWCPPRLSEFISRAQLHILTFCTI